MKRALTLDHLQQREEHWAIVDLVGREACSNVPVPIGSEPNWTIGSPQPQLIEEGCSPGQQSRKAWGDGMTVKAVGTS